MRRRTVTLALLALLIAAGDAAAGEGVKVAKCSPREHVAVFHARMTRIPDAERMWMRFTLLARTGPEGFVPVKAPGLGRWRGSDAGVRAFSLRQVVRNIAPGAIYRARVDFRWEDEDGDTLRRSRRRSPRCAGDGPLPNLRVQVVDASATRVDGVLRYGVRVWNAGKAAATGVGVRLAVDGATLDTRTLALLAPGDSQVVYFRGPACAGSVEGTVDPERTVAEVDEADNVHQLACRDVPRQ